MIVVAKDHVKRNSIERRTIIGFLERRLPKRIVDVFDPIVVEIIPVYQDCITTTHERAFRRHLIRYRVLARVAFACITNCNQFDFDAGTTARTR